MAKRTYREGTFSTVNNRPNSPLRFRKSINGKYISVYGKTERECIRKMKEKEAELLEKEKYTHPTDISNCALLQDAVKYWLQRAGISKNISIHGLRHTGISYWIRHGVDIASISRTAGHTDISTTTRIYYNIKYRKYSFKYFKRIINNLK